MANEFVARKGLIVPSGSILVTSGSVTASNFVGTASVAISSSFATTASFALNAAGSGFPFSGSAVITGSLNVTQAVTASYFKGDGSQLVNLPASEANAALRIDSYTFEGDGVTTNYILSQSYYTADGMVISIGGVTYAPTIDYTVVGSTLSFVEAPTSQSNIIIRAFVAVSSGSINTLSGSFVGDFTGSLVGTATTASYVEYTNIANKPTLVSASSQINTGSFSGSFIGALTGTSSWANNVDYTNVTNKPTLVSASSQIDVRNTTGIATIATTGSNTFVGDQIISGSLTTTADTMTFNGSMSVSGSLAVTGSINLTNGTLIGTSSWANNAITASYVEYNNVANKPTLVSASSQIDVRNTTGIATIATTGSNTFTGVQTISNTTNSTSYLDGALIVAGGVGIAKDVRISGSLTVNGLLTAVSMSTQYVTSSQYNVGVSRITLNDDDTVRFSGLSIYDSGSSSPTTASILWDSLQHRFIYENLSGSSYNSAIIIAGPKHTGSLGDERELTVNRIPYASGGDHIDDSPARVAGTTVHFDADIYVTGSVTAAAFTGSVSGTTSTASYVEYTNVANKPTLVSASSQISYTGVSNIPADIVSSSTQVKEFLPSGTVSSSTQYPGWVTASSQIDYTQLQNIPVGIVSSSTQINTGSFSGSFVGSLTGTSSWANNAVTASYSSDADLFDGKDSATFATTGSNTFTATQTIAGNVFLSASFPLVYNNSATNNMLFGFYDGGSIYGAYYQTFGNNYAALNQRGGAEFVYDIRNNSDANFHVASYNGSTWTEKFRVDDTGIVVTGSIKSTGGVTGSLYGTSSWANNAISSSYAITSSYALNAGAGAGFPFSGSAVITGSLLVSGSGIETVGGGFTGSLLGTSSVAVSSSYALTASYALNAQSGGTGAGFPFSGSAVITGSLLVVPEGGVNGITGSFSGSGAGLHDLRGSLAIDTYNFIGNGATTEYYLSQSYTANSLIVTVEGMTNLVGGDFILSGPTMSFTVAPPTQSNVLVKAFLVASSGSYATYTGSFVGNGSGLTNLPVNFQIQRQTFTGNGATQNYILSQSYIPSGIVVTVGGLRYIDTNDYSLSGTTLQFVQAPPSNSIIVVDAFINASSGSVGTFSGSFLGTATSASFATTASYASNVLKTKAGSIAYTSFGGLPYTASVTFTTAFPNTNYAVVVTGEDARVWTVENKTASGFKVNTNSNTALTGTTYWTCTAYGEN